MVDGPCTNVARQALAFKHMSLTDLKIKVPRGARSGVVKKVFTDAEVLEKWEKTSWAKKLTARKKKASMTDFDRFKLKLAKQKVRFLYIFPIKLSFIQINLRNLRKWLIDLF